MENNMRKYAAFFRLRFSLGLQYRAAALSGLLTQFTWGALEILSFMAFYRDDSGAFPMKISATASYIWMQQAFLALFTIWLMENEIFDTIKNGDIAYELCRPIHLFDMWFSRSIANRVSKALLRCMPILIVAALLPKPYGLSAPASGTAFILFILTLILGLIVTVAFSMLIYTLTFFTISPVGIRTVTISSVEFLSGAIIPIPFFPDRIRDIVELLPFASMQNVPLRIYSGDLYGNAMIKAITLQCFWLATLVLMGKLLMNKALKRVVVQGG